MIKERQFGNKQAIGFGSKILPDNANPYEIIENVNEQDLISYGMIPEFVGRIPLLVSVGKLGKEELVKILVEPKNSLVKQYTKLFSLWNINLNFTEEALLEMAEKVLDRHTGARGLKFVMEEVLKHTMFQVESH
jgi:ATP-dependent Clp protease ATP-binding subunit ClpX